MSALADGGSLYTTETWTQPWDEPRLHDEDILAQESFHYNVLSSGYAVDYPMLLRKVLFKSTHSLTLPKSYFKYLYLLSATRGFGHAISDAHVPPCILHCHERWFSGVQRFA